MRSERIRLREKRRRIKIILIIVIFILVIILFFLGYKFLFKSRFIFENYDHIKGAIYEVVEYNEAYDDNISVKYGNLLFGYKKVEDVKKVSVRNIDTNKIGIYNIKYQVKYKNHKKNIEKIIEVKDTKTPVIDCFNVEEVHMCKGSNKYNLKCSANDNYDGDITYKLEEKLDGEYVVLKVSDSSKNQAIKKIKAIFLDNEKPSLTLNGDKVISIPVGSVYQEKGAISIDNCDLDITSKIEISSNINTNMVGDYEVNYKIKDKSGNMNEAKRIVKVYENSDLPSEKVIYLTFDDGPYKHTSRLLDILKKYNIKATFFVTNQYDSYASLIKREFEEGHQVGIHSYSHLYSDIYSSVDNYFNDLYKLDDLIWKQTGVRTKLVRLPGGSSNIISKNYKLGIMSEITNKLNNLGYTYFDWNCSSGDAGETTSSKQVALNVKSCMESGKTLVVLQHDIKGFSVDAVEDIIKTGIAYGYTFKTLDESSNPLHHKIYN